ncbi:MAG: alpha/beta hydrolase [Alphaproteobacteria bacterium]|nr:alpha/beta hydrolase [Alphaproteobacteria bacterium]
MTPSQHVIHANGLDHHVWDSQPLEVSRPAVLLLHGFPDDHTVWDPLTPHLLDAGYRVIAPDLRGFGETGIADAVSQYEMRTGAIPDVLGVLDALDPGPVHLVGHDFGASLAWLLAAQHPDRFRTLAALSVGHPRAFLEARKDPVQMRMSFYILQHQFRGLCEWAYKRNDWAWFRAHWDRHCDMDGAIARLSRPGRLTAGLNWYRANAGLDRMLNPPTPGALGEERVSIPTLGVWSDGDKYLGERQMRASGDLVDAAWRYERFDGVGHWLQAEVPERLMPVLLEHWR